MRAYLTEGQLIAEHATLERLGPEVGLPADAARDMPASDRFAAQVRDHERTAARLGIQAVPFFVVDRAIGASGAHRPEALVELLRQGRARPPRPRRARAGSTA